MVWVRVWWAHMLWEMEDLNDLSNEELQYRLAQFGAPNVPITSTTRKILVKRLRNLIETEKSKLRRDTEYATRYSSDEDVSANANNSKPSTKAAKGRSRSTISVNTRLGNRSNLNMPPPSSTTIQKPSTSLWIDKSQVRSLWISYPKRKERRRKSIYWSNIGILIYSIRFRQQKNHQQVQFTYHH